MGNKSRKKLKKASKAKGDDTKLTKREARNCKIRQESASETGHDKKRKRKTSTCTGDKTVPGRNTSTGDETKRKRKSKTSNNINYPSNGQMEDEEATPDLRKYHSIAKNKTFTLEVQPEISLISMSYRTKSATMKQRKGFEGTAQTSYGINWYGDLDAVLRTEGHHKKKASGKRKELQSQNKLLQARGDYVKRLADGDHCHMNEETVIRIQDTLTDCINDSVEEWGWRTALERKDNDYALGYLEGILSSCSIKQRKTLIETGGEKSPLFLAYKLRNVKALDFFYNFCGVQIECPGKCLLMSAIMKGDVEIATLLFKTTGKTPCPVDGHATPLLVACGGYPIDFDFHKVTKKEKWKGFPDDRPYSYEYYCSFVETYKDHKGNAELVQRFIDLGALSNNTDPCSVFKSFAVCIDKEDYDILNILLQSMDCVDVFTDRAGCTPLGYAVQRGNLKAMKLLILNGADINKTKVLVNSRLSPTPKTSDTPLSQQSETSRTRGKRHPTKNQKLKRTKNGRNIATKRRQSMDKDGVDDEDQYVHPVVYAMAEQYYDVFYYLLHCKEVPFEEKMNALDLFGAKIAMQSVSFVNDRMVEKAKDQVAAYDIWERTESWRSMENVEKKYLAEPRRIMNNYTEETYHSSMLSPCKTLIQAYLTHERVLGYNLRLTLPSVKLVANCYDIKGWFFLYMEFLAFYLKRAFPGSDKNSEEYEDAIYLLKRMVIAEVKFVYMGLSIHDYEDFKATCDAVYAAGFIVPTRAAPVKGFPCSVLDCLLVTIRLLLVSACAECSDDPADLETIRDITRYVQPILQMDPRCPHLESLLHKAVRLQYGASAWMDPTTTYYEEIPRYSTATLVLFLLDCGVNQNAHDLDKNMAFHTFLKDIAKFTFGVNGYAQVEVDAQVEVGNMLLNSGFPTDIENVNGETPDSLSLETHLRFKPIRELN